MSSDLGTAGAFIDASTRLRMASHAGRIAFGAKVWFGPRSTLGLTLTSPSLSVWRDVSFERAVA